MSVRKIVLFVATLAACTAAHCRGNPQVVLPVARIEAEKGEMLPDAKGGRAGPYDKIAGTSGGSILAFFSRGRGVRYGKTPAPAKWVAVCFGTNNGGNDATVQFFDGDRHLGDVVFPDTGDFHVLRDIEVAKLDIPAGADLRIVAPNLPVNIDYIDLYDTDARPVIPDARPPSPPVAELREKLFAGGYGKFDEIVLLINAGVLVIDHVDDQFFDPVVIKV